MSKSYNSGNKYYTGNGKKQGSDLQSSMAMEPEADRGRIVGKGCSIHSIGFDRAV